jgi:hypothetical protein
MNAGGALDVARRIAGHSALSTTQIYDRSQDRVTIAEVERVCFPAASEQLGSARIAMEAEDSPAIYIAFDVR